VVVSVPGLGDEVQTLKAGVLEIADIHVVNEADREGAGRVEAELRSMLALSDAADQAWLPPLLSCVATREENVAPLFDAICRHLDFLRSSREFDRRRKRMVKARVLGIAHDLVNEATARAEYESDDLYEQVCRREIAPQTAGRLLLARLVTEKDGATKL
jgi:LAO/AO transport system kinase